MQVYKYLKRERKGNENLNKTNKTSGHDWVTWLIGTELKIVASMNVSKELKENGN